MNVIKELWHGNIVPQEDCRTYKGDERTTRIHGKASRGLRENLHRRAERTIRKVPCIIIENIIVCLIVAEQKAFY